MYCSNVNIKPLHSLEPVIHNDTFARTSFEYFQLRSLTSLIVEPHILRYAECLLLWQNIHLFEKEAFRLYPITSLANKRHILQLCLEIYYPVTQKKYCFRTIASNCKINNFRG